MLLMCLVVFGFGQLCFVQGWRVPIKDKVLTSKIPCFVRERPPLVNKDVKIITSKIKSAQSAGELLDYVDTVVDKPIFNYIHVAATYTKLAKLQKKANLGPKEVQSSVLVRLEDRLQGMLVRRQVEAQALSNIIWAFANLFSDVPAVLKIVPALAEQIPSKVGKMVPQELSHSLWAAAQLQNTTPEVLKTVPALAAEISLNASKMDPQGLSNS